MISGEASPRGVASHHVADGFFGGTRSAEPGETLGEAGVARGEAVGESEAAQEEILDGPRTDSAD